MLRAALVVVVAVGAAVAGGVSAPVAGQDAPVVSVLDEGSVDRDDVVARDTTIDRDDFTLAGVIDRDDVTGSGPLDRDDFDGGNGGEGANG
jgi:hypothetical protein